MKTFDTPLAEAVVGRTGKTGLLELDLAPVAGATRVVGQYHQAPLYIYQPIYLDSYRPDMAFVYLQQSGDGLVQGDRYRIDIRAAAGAAVHLTTQTATKIYGMHANLATQLVHLDAGPDAVLEYLPDPLIPFRGSRFFSRTCLTVDPRATVVLGEILLPGRVAFGESHDYDLYWSEIRVREASGKPLFRDVLNLVPATTSPTSPGRLGPHHVHATLHVLARRECLSVLCAAVDSALGAHPGVLAGASELPGACGITVRFLGPTSATVAAALGAAWNAVRLRLIGAPAPDLRKG
ncbi:urease accessory protein UreD [Streptomyces sp. TRM 70351]|uniref:urease accessory protein UreD n=1 Tax=Streptomyces sp. TRM 70351 TaxID=3116552 RepID=UPI002E7B7205|nr:urease accessory protein UreD [Streptomyces sp. TRM 70351]MEE1928792.1 urease accessory protein UreD [Streptomyces sp. TRM 70351]